MEDAETERKTENQMEILVQKRYGKCAGRDGGFIGHDKVEDICT